MTGDHRSTQAPKAPLLFLSHAGEDAGAAKALAVQLRAAGLDVWFDVEKLQPGDAWQKEIAAALRSAQAVVLYVGRSGVIRWVDFEMQLALDRRAKDSAFRIIPILGPGSDPAALPDFVKLFQWVDLRAAPSTDNLKGLVAAILNTPAEQVSVLPPDHTPFRGLLHFGVDDAILFFGREQETEELLEHLRRDPLLMVIGDSGCGKSSLVRAGLIPALLRGRFSDGRSWVTSWRIAITRPGNDPFRELAENLPDLGSGNVDRKSEIASNRNLLSVGADGLRDIVAGSVPAGTRTCLVVDQFEELFTLTPDASMRQRYIDSLLRAASSVGDRPVHVVLTLRADFYVQCFNHESLIGRIVRNQYAVCRMPAERLRQLVERPLGLAGATAEPGLVDAILEDVGNEPGHLALLEHALDQLWERRSANGGIRITHAAYNAMGRLEGALRNHANGALARLPDDSARDLARRFLVELTQLGEGTEDTRRRVAIQELYGAVRGPNQALLVLEKLATERLITTGDNYAEVAHEALIRRWPELRGWIDEDREFERLKRRLAQEAAEWERVKRDAEALLGGARLAEAEEWLGSSRRERRELKPVILEFIQASVDKRQRTADEREAQRQAQLHAVEARAQAEKGAAEQARLRAVEADARLSAERKAAKQLKATVAVVVAASILLAYVAYRSNVNKRAAQEQLARNYWDASRTAREGGQFLESLRWTAAALSLDPSKALAEALLLDVRDILPQVSLTAILQHDGSVGGAVFSPDASRILTWSDEDRTVRLWDAASGKQLGAPLQHADRVGGAVFSPDASRILTWTWGGAAQLWDAGSGKQLGPPLQHADGVDGAVFSRDGSRILTWHNVVQLWDSASGKQLVPPLEHGAIVRGAVFSRDESKILTWSQDGTARLWDAASGKQLGPSFKHRDRVFGAVFSRDESRILTWSQDGTARLWDAASGKQLGPPLQHGHAVFGAIFSRDESRILTWTWGGAAQLWDAASGKQLGPPLQHDGLGGAVFSRDESRILTWSDDHTARLWDAASGKQLGPSLQHGDKVNGAVFSRDGSRILTWSQDGAARLWDAASGKQLGPPLQHDAAVWGAVFSQDESGILTYGDDHTARLWDVAGGKQLGTSLQHGDVVWGAVFNQDGRRVLTWSKDRTARLWDAASGTQVGPSLQHGDQVNGAVFSRDESRILTWSDDHTARLWDAASGAQLGPPLQHGDVVWGAVFSQDGRRILTWGKDRTARLWDAASGAQLGPPLQHEDVVWGAVFSQDGRRILTWGGANSSLWDAASGRQLRPPLEHDATAEYDIIHEAVFSPDDSRILTSGGDRTARLWDAVSGRQLGPSLHHEGTVWGAVFSRDGRRILTWSKDWTARLWDAASSKQLGPSLQHGDEINGAVFSQDESRILTWSDDHTARLWDAASGKQLGPSLQHGDKVEGAVFSRDESRILTWSNDDHTARLWDAASGKQLGPSLQHGDKVEGAVFSRDESRILTWSDDHTAQLWQVCGDLDFPQDEWAIQLMAMTGTEFDLATRQTKVIDPQRWRDIQKRYRGISAQHSKVCKFRSCNDWQRFLHSTH